MYLVGSRVKVVAAIDYGAGTQHWDGRTGTVRVARRRSCDVQLDGEQDLLWFFHRELVILTD